MSAEALQCKECRARYPLEARFACDACFGPLEVSYDHSTLEADETRRRIQAGPPTIWRYADFLPFDRPPRTVLSAGVTPLVRADRLAERLGLEEVWVKNDAANPTHSFKDRVVTVALAKARELGYETVACASTGNLANAVAAHAAAAGLESYVFVPADLEEQKLLATEVYGTNVITVNGNYDEVNRLCTQISGERDWAFVNVNVRPYYAEGSKTLGFEMAEQLGWTLPDHVVAPMASGSMLVKIDKAFTELTTVGLVDEKPWKVSGAQATGCSPIATALKDGTGFVKPVRPDTLAKSLAIGNPADGYYAIDAVRRTGGWMEDVSDSELVDAIGLLARTEGIFAETAGGVTIAVLKKLAEQGRVEPSERTVAVVSGLGLKTLPVIADRVGPSFTITPALDDFQSALTLKEQQ